MKKKIISGLLVVLFTGTLGAVTVSEAVVGGRDQMDTVEMRRGRRHHRGAINDEQTELEKKVDAGDLTEEEAVEIQKKWEESNDYSYNRRENSSRNHMGGTSGRHYGRMNNSCR